MFRWKQGPFASFLDYTATMISRACFRLGRVDFRERKLCLQGVPSLMGEQGPALRHRHRAKEAQKAWEAPSSFDRVRHLDVEEGMKEVLLEKMPK